MALSGSHSESYDLKSELCHKGSLSNTKSSISYTKLRYIYQILIFINNCTNFASF